MSSLFYFILSIWKYNSINTINFIGFLFKINKKKSKIKKSQRDNLAIILAPQYKVKN